MLLNNFSIKFQLLIYNLNSLSVYIITLLSNRLQILAIFFLQQSVANHKISLSALKLIHSYDHSFENCRVSSIIPSPPLKKENMIITGKENVVPGNYTARAVSNVASICS